MGNTVFEINPEAWNNVPSIIYEAVYTLVTEADNARKRATMAADSARKDQFQLRQQLQMAEQAAS